MPNTKQPPNAGSFIEGLQNLFSSLPSEQQRGEAVDAFDKVIHFLTNARDKFAALPTQEQAAELQPSLMKLEGLFRNAETPSSDNLPAALEEPKKPRSRTAKVKENEIDVSALVGAIRQLPAEAIRSQLEDKQHSVAVVKAVAVAVGLKVSSRESKASLIERTVNFIENIRMSDRLAGRSDGEYSILP